MATGPQETSAQRGGPPILVARNLTKQFDEMRALDDVSIDVPAGTIVGLIGPSGCGKTTLVRSLIGVTTPTSGTVEMFGVDPSTFRPSERQRFGYMPQLPVLFQNLSAWGNLNFIASVYGLPVRRRRRHLMRLLDLVDLTAHRGKQLSELSGGMQRRLTLAATLVHDPELLFLDEPTAGVDPILRERFWSHFRNLRDQGRTIVVPTQYVGEAASCDLVAVMVAGRLVTVATPAELPQRAFGGDSLLLPLQRGWLGGDELARLQQLPYVRQIRKSDEGLVAVVDDASTDASRIEQHLTDAGFAFGHVTPFEPSLDEVFVALVERAKAEDAAVAERVAAA